MDGAVAGLVVATEHNADLGRLQELLVANGNSVEVNAGSLRVDVDGADPRVIAAKVSRAAAANDLALVELHVERMNLEERYLAITNGGIR